ncbi:ribonuclease E inhibitor RraA/Dimethylmenaquinone methyltransferase [Lentinula raphanica]|uniref:Ribonuclease E inhibitor RraA/Dimethylmenaquinone methyltransferase n=1 Tax=Lentinula raphanica TaxID=153919 RepID=A0AA38PJL6_9AGAR|nr:ribonuclease E inhibitor RraA/Dimethylmenaquinone methyltransferase [Lentinula raphanica]KAJ3827305.1 ribonuclease E inhibitor RraA/Dimethylmenaquinone methyltransferase [Lentinula raphanica]KAJ3844175.1 ribonuclease E inhibitor RraA/Dimethylmenaquinone methyltransferase [Lentinula raphanica]
MSSLSSFSSCELSDALIKLGVPSGGYIPDINHFSGKPICGPAYTVKFVYSTETGAPTLSEHFVDTAPSGSVIVIDAPPHAKNAVWGGLMTAGAQSRNALGVVISGRCRDLAEHREFAFPVYARGHSTVGQSPFTRPSAINVPLVLVPEGDTKFPPTQVNPGDWIIADEDGVVCVPKDLEMMVAELATKSHAIDERCMADIKAGKGVKASFAEHRGTKK